MPSLGTFVLLAGFVMGAYAAAASVAGARRRSRRLVESGLGAFYMVTALMTLASGIIVHAFVTNNYAIKYVQRYSDSAQPVFYKLASYWGGLDGSILFWVFLLSVFGAIAVYTNRERQRELIPYVVAVIAVVEMFFLFLMVIHNNPFETYLTETHADGSGLNPLLQNFYMAIHPPALYTGFVGMTIPYAFGMAALITGYLDDSWLRAVRRWTMISWLCLSFGLTLGMLWAYEELGWGGYWGWDPVENAGLLPWFTATAFLHSVMVQERRGMLRVWNVSLVIVSFFLTIFGTFMTRSGVVQSVHAFGEDRELATMFTVFMVLMLAVSFGYVIYRLPLLKARHELDSWASKEAAFLANNWVLLFSAFFVLFATMFPTLSEALMHQRLTVGPPFFNKWMAPIGLILLFLTGIGPLLAWRKSTLGNLRHQFLWPTIGAIVVAGTLVALGVRVWSSGLCFALSAFVFSTIAQEFWRGARVRQGATGTDVATALIGLVARSRRRYGGYIVHLGIVLMFLGFAGEGFKTENQVLLKPGEQTVLRGYTVKHGGIRVSDDGQKQMVFGTASILRDGRQIDTMHPGRFFFRKHEEQPTTEVAIRRGFAEDLYVVLAGYDMQTQSATYQIVVNPLVNWIWLGFAIMAIGTGIALLPESAFAFAVAKMPAASVTATTMLLLVLLLPVPVRAQGPQSTMPDQQRSELRQQLLGEIMCTCGCRASMKDCPMGPTCHGLQEQTPKIDQALAQGLDHDRILAAFVADYGQQVLMSPPDKGFNRLAWLFPYLAGLTGLGTVIAVARRWSRRQAAAKADTSAAVAPAGNGADAEISERLDDELRDLD